MYQPSKSYIPSPVLLPAFLLFGTEIHPKILLSFVSYHRIEINSLYQILSSDKHLSNCGSLAGFSEGTY